MISFEYIAALLLEAEGFWTRTRVKIVLSKREKRRLGNPSMPRPEIDVVAFKPKTNELRLVECKSYLDSGGVSVRHLTPGNRYANRLKFFGNLKLRQLVQKRVVEEFVNAGALGAPPKIHWELFAGCIKHGQEEEVERLLKMRKWLLRRPSAIAHALRSFADRGYEDELATVVTKLLERNPDSDGDDGCIQNA